LFNGAFAPFFYCCSISSTARLICLPTATKAVPLLIGGKSLDHRRFHFEIALASVVLNFDRIEQRLKIIALRFQDGGLAGLAVPGTTTLTGGAGARSMALMLPLKVPSSMRATRWFSTLSPVKNTPLSTSIMTSDVGLAVGVVGRVNPERAAAVF
jgi:hypothetical protein